MGGRRPRAPEHVVPHHAELGDLVELVEEPDPCPPALPSVAAFLEPCVVGFATSAEQRDERRLLAGGRIERQLRLAMQSAVGAVNEEVAGPVPRGLLTRRDHVSYSARGVRQRGGAGSLEELLPGREAVLRLGAVALVAQWIERPPPKR